MSREALIDELNDGFGTLVASVEGLTDEQMLRRWFGDWGVREILAHVSGWHREMTVAFERIAAGERPVPEGVDYNDADAWNSKFAAGAADRTAREALEDVKASKESFVAAALRVPEDRFAEGKAAYRIIFTTGIDHYKEHEPVIREWRRSEGL